MLVKLLWGGHLARPDVPHNHQMCCIYRSEGVKYLVDLHPRPLEEQVITAFMIK